VNKKVVLLNKTKRATFRKASTYLSVCRCQEEADYYQSKNELLKKRCQDLEVKLY